MPHAGYFCRRLSKRCVAVSARKVDLQCRGLHEHSFELRTVDPMTGEAKSGFTFDIELLSGMWWIKSIRCLLARAALEDASGCVRQWPHCMQATGV